MSDEKVLSSVVRHKAKHKLYKRGIPKRLAKKWIGRSWHKLQYGLSLKPGDLISSCKGYNERVLEVVPCWNYTRQQRIVSDFDIETEVGSCCSLCSCCTYPLETRDQIIAYWLSWDTPEARAWLPPDHRCAAIIQGIKDGVEVFDVDGQPTYDFAADYEKKVRFPERYALAERP